MPTYANGAESTLSSACSATDTIITLQDASTFTSSTPFPVICENEIMSVTNRVGNALYVTRAAESYAAVRLPFSHPLGATVTAILTGGLLATLTVGPQGPPGPAGGTGPTGATGATGATGPAGAGLSPGFVAPFAGASVPSGWLACDGSAVSQATYPALFTVLGTTWGPATGGNFTLPDLRDRTPIGTSPGGLSGNRPTVRTLAQTGGEETHVLLTAELAQHRHTLNDVGHLHASPDGYDFGTFSPTSALAMAGADILVPTDSGSGNVQTAFTGVTMQNAGSNTGHNTMQPFAVIQWLIKT